MVLEGSYKDTEAAVIGGVTLAFAGEKRSGRSPNAIGEITDGSEDSLGEEYRGTYCCLLDPEE